MAAGLYAPTFVTIIDLGRLRVEAYVDEVAIDIASPYQGRLRPEMTTNVSVRLEPIRALRGVERCRVSPTMVSSTPIVRRA